VERREDSQPSETHITGKAELLNGERYWFSKEEETEIQEHNKQYYHTSPAEEVYAETFRQPEGSDDHVLELSAANIYERLRKLHPKAMQSISSTAFARLMPTLAAVEHTHIDITANDRELRVANNLQPRGEVATNKKGLQNLSRQYAACGKSIRIEKSTSMFAVSIQL